MGQKQHHPMVELSVACQMAGQALLLIAGQLQQRHWTDDMAADMQTEGIDRAANDVLTALAAYTAAAARGPL